MQKLLNKFYSPCTHAGVQIVVSLCKAIRLVKHDLPLVHPCWLLLITFLSSLWIEVSYIMRHSIIFPGIELRLTGL